MASAAPTSVRPTAQPASAPVDANKPTTVIAALPLGGRIKLDPWSDQLEMIKSKPVGAVAEREKMPFEITPFILYLTRQTGSSAAGVHGDTAAASASNVDANTPEPATANPR